MSVVQLPLVSVGLPVYNGGTSLEAALDCLLAQDYPNIEFIISDNASTDATPKICEEYSRNEPRIKYSRCHLKKTMAWNFNHVFELSTGKYFMWAADDDLRESSFVSACVEIMESHADAVLCQAHTAIYIEGNDEILHVAKLDSFNNKLDLVDRYEETLRHFPATAIYGLYRSSVVRKTHIYQESIAADLAFIQELSIYGRFVQVPKILFKYYGGKKWNTVNQDYNLFCGGKTKPWWYLPFIALFCSHYKRIVSSNIPFSTKFHLCFVLVIHEVEQIVFKLVMKLVRAVCSEQLKENRIRSIYLRWMHNPNINIVNDSLYMERVIKPMLRI